MSDIVVTPTVAAACSVVTGVVCYPFLAAMGIDPASMGAGLLGCTIAQSFLKRDEAVNTGQLIRTVVIVTIGSVFFASLISPVVSPLVLAKLAEWKWPHREGPVSALTAGALGAFAQPLFMFAKTWGVDWALEKIKKLLPVKGSGDA